jgi:hypothetical protein
MEKHGPKTFVASELCAAAGIKPATLRTWRARWRDLGFLSIDKDHDREWTRYSEADALRVMLLAALVRNGIEPSVGVSVILNKKEHEFLGVWERLRAGKPQFVTVSMLDPDPRGGLFVFSGTPPVIRADDTDDTDAVTIVIDLGKIYRNAQHALGAT